MEQINYERNGGMFFSIIVPVYNVEKYLRKCLDSLLCQEYKDYEVIIVDDGSEDGSGYIADEYVLRYPTRLKVIHQNNKGLGGARNTGIDASTGEYLVFIDSDDYVADNFLAKANHTLIEHDIDILVFNYCEVSERGKVTSPAFDWRAEYEEVDTKSILEQHTTWNKIYKRWLFLDTGIRFPEHLLYEDLATTPMLVTVNPKVGRIGDAWYFYLQRKGSIMREVDGKKVLQIITAMERVISFYEEKNLYTEFYAELEWMALQNVLYAGSARILLPLGRIDLSALEKLNSWMNEKFPEFQQNIYYTSNVYNGKYACMRDIVNKKYRYVQWKYYGKIRLKKRIKKELAKLKSEKDMEKIK